MATTGRVKHAKRSSSGSTSAIAFAFGLIFVFLILAAQYESWSLPFGVMMAVPFAMLGALVAIALRGIPNDIYFQIGLLTLIGLAAKNAILIVEFAVELNRKEGKSFFDAAVEAARLRLRPIVMTSFAFILGVVPLAIATGASSNSRHSIGTGRHRRHAGRYRHRDLLHPDVLLAAGNHESQVLRRQEDGGTAAARAAGGTAPARAPHAPRKED